jgi:hypothetical protein
MSDSDGFNIHHRVEAQIDLLLKEMEETPENFAFKERLALITTLGMYLTRNLKLSAADESVHAGSAVRKYSGAFKTAHVSGGGKSGGGQARQRATPAARLAIAHDADEDDPDTAA